MSGVKPKGITGAALAVLPHGWGSGIVSRIILCGEAHSHWPLAPAQADRFAEAFAAAHAARAAVRLPSESRRCFARLQRKDANPIRLTAQGPTS